MSACENKQTGKVFFLSSSLVTRKSLAQGRRRFAYKSRWGVYRQHSNRMIQALLIAFLATLAAAEAQPKADEDSYLIYNGYPYPHGLTYVAG